MKKSLILMAIIFVNLQINAQQIYSFSYFTDAYTDLSGSTVLNDSTWDDPGYVIPVGFSFPFFDSTYTNIVVNPTGYGSWLTPTNYIPLNGNVPQPIILPISTDLIDRGYNTTTWSEDGNTLSPISYLTEGTSGNRILKIEYKNAGFYDDLDNTSASNDSINFQVWLYETGDVEYRYGSRGGITNYLTEVGIYPFYNYSNEVPTDVGMEVDGSMNSPIANMGTSYPSLNLDVNNGMVYRFSYGFVNVESNILDGEISIFPNPVSSELRINYNNNVTINSISISNVNGKVVKQIINQQVNTIDVSDLESGVYFINFKTNQEQVTKKIIIQ